MENWLRKVPLKWVGYGAAACVLGTYLLMAIQGPQGFRSLLGKWDDVRKLEQENAILNREVQEKRDRNRRLENSMDEINIEIRKRLEMQQPGQVDFKVPAK